LQSTANITTTANISGGNILTGGAFSTTANITGGNLLTGGLISATGNVSGGNLNVTGNIVDTGALSIITGSNGNIALAPNGSGIVTSSGAFSAVGNITGGNINTGGVVSSTGNVVGGNVNTAGLITATGNVTGGNLNTGAQVIATGNVTGGNVLSLGIITATGNVTGNVYFGNASQLTIDGTNVVGYKNIPQNSQSADYTLVIEDAGKHILHPAADANARTFTIPANSSVPYPIGTAIAFINLTSQVVTIAITSDTMYLSPVGTTGSRSLAQYGTATAIKITSTSWLISGSGLS
jgi:hypothetical protein